MLDRIIALSLHHRVLVAIAALAIAVAGTVTVLRMPIDVLPNLDRPLVTILTEAPGMVTEDVEMLVTWPIEQAVNGAAGVYRVRSGSASGLSVVYVEFGWDVDVYRARQVVSERIRLLEMPDGIRPEMAPVSSIMGQILVLGFLSRDGSTTQQELRLILDRDVAPRLRSVTGVAQIVTTGSRRTEVRIEADLARLRAHGVTLQELRAAVQGANVSVIGGRMETDWKAPGVAVTGRIATPAELADAVVRDLPGRPILVRDVAELSLGPSTIGVGDAGVDGRPGALVVVTKQPGVDTVALTDRLLEELTRIRDELPPDVDVVDDVFRQSSFIERAITNVLDAVRDGAILVVIVLFLFLMNLRTTLITLTALPLSVAIAALVFDAFGLSIDTMTLGGLAVAVGTLVDDAIVDVENVYRRLWENGHAERPKPVLMVVLEASREVRKPVMYGTLLVTVVYLPLFFLSGIEGRLFAPIGLAYIVSVMASLLVAMTVTPVLCFWLLGERAGKADRYGGRVVDLLRNTTERVVRASLNRPWQTLGVAVAATLCAAVLLFSRGTTFLPPFNEGSAQVNLILPADASLETADAFGRRLEEVLLDVDGVAHVARRTGRAEGDEHIMPVNVNEAVLTFDPDLDRSREAILEDIRGRLEEHFPGVPSEVEQPLAHLLSHMLSGVTAQVAIKITGTDLQRLRELADDVERRIEAVPGVRDLIVEPLVMIDQVQVEPRREALGRLGITVADVADTVSLAMGGAPIDEMPAGRITFPIRIALAEADRAEPAALADLYVRASGDELVRLGDVADVRVTATPNEVKRENVQRRIVVKHNVAGRALGDVVADVETAIAPLRDALAGEPGYGIRIGGQFEAQRDATRVVLSLSLVSIALMVLIVQMHFGSLRIAAIVLLTRPIAFIGAVLVVVLTDQPLSIATLVGLIALLGVAARNAILLIEHILHLITVEGERIEHATIVRAARERVVPVTMTALTSGIALIPLALSPDEPGRELLYPVATVVIGGLVTNTLLDFALTPGVLWLFARQEFERLAARSG